MKITVDRTGIENYGYYISSKDKYNKICAHSLLGKKNPTHSLTNIYGHFGLCSLKNGL